MAKQSVNLGTGPNEGDGDPLRNAFDKVNDNIDELYTLFGDGSTLNITGDASLSGGTLTISDDAIDSDQIVNGAIDNVHLADDAVDHDELANRYTASSSLSSGATIPVASGNADVFTLTLGHSATLNFTGVKVGDIKTIVVTGGGSSYTLTLGTINSASATWNLITGTYDDTSSTKNLIQIKFVSTTEAWYSISQISS